MIDKSFVGKPLNTAGGGQVFINPGTGPVDGASERNASENISAFIDDLQHDDAGAPNGLLVSYSRDRERDYGEGRFAFVLRAGDRTCEVQMPGLLLDQVRWRVGMNAWQFPRLYVDGSSWWWGFALGCAYDALFGNEDDE